jgi:amino-acid N-acetyltransferase
MDPQITLERPTDGEISRIEAILRRNGLPADDVRANAEQFFVASTDGKFVGIGGVETYGSAGLLRSVVVTEPYRNHGYGTALCANLESYARTEGVTALYLLTTAAATFFRQRDYEEVSRAEPPRCIRETTEFTTLCPDSATCLRKRL